MINKRLSRVLSMSPMLSRRKGISEVVTTVIMIALVLLASVLVWTIVNDLLREKIKSSESCFGNLEKVALDKKNICYDDSSTPNKVRFAISLGDVEVDEILVSISNDAETKSFKIRKNSQEDGLTYLDGSSPAELPPKNGGKTYLYQWTGLPAKSVKIAPIIDGTQCEISDSSSELDNCLLLS